MQFGRPCFRENNDLLNALFERKKVLICAHRGSWRGNVTQNTTIACQAALMQGTDILETDTTATTDDVVLSLHDGVEPEMFGLPLRCSLKMTSAQIEELYPRNALGQPSSHRVQRLEDVLAFLSHDELINIDRAWRARDLVLPLLDRFPGMRRQAIIKAPLDAVALLEQLDDHPVKYMFMPICYSLADVEKALSYRNLNMVGVELIAHTEADELYSDEAIRYLHSKDLFCWVNALVITDCNPIAALYGSLDDDHSILDGPDAGWGVLIDKGIDVIQTDWPSILRDYRLKKLGV